MEKQCIFSKNGPPAAGPYSHAVIAGDMLYVSGQGPLARDGSGVVRGTFEEETRRTLDNLKAIIEDAGSSMEQVVKVTAYLLDIGNFAAFNQVYKEYFVDHYPARTCIQAAKLPAGIQVEVEAIAIVPGR